MKKFLEDKLPFYNSLVLPLHLVKAVVCGVRYGWPGRKMTVIGVTGTNGKTSTCFMIWKMLKESGQKVGVMTTVGWGVDEIKPEVEHMTTADVGVLNRRMKKIYEAGAEFLVLEVTSHALAQYRTLGVPIEVAVMTNVTHEHLDYHKTFERYVQAKRKLFKKAKYGVINADDKSAGEFIETITRGAGGVSARKKGGVVDVSGRNYITYGIKNGDLRAFEVKTGVSGVEYACGDIKIERSEHAVGLTDASDYQVGRMEVKTQIPGEFSVYNSLAAVAVGLRLGLTETEVVEGIGALEAVEGRMNRVDAGQDYGVIVDFAHTPDAFEKVFNSVKPARESGRIISVFGGAGRRDESTRAERGEIAGGYSDVVIVTEDDSRDEEPEKIAEMFVEGAEKAGKVRGKDLLVELDREKAIYKACEMARLGDLVLVLGKGHEKTILRADGAHEFEDLKVTEKVVKELMKGGK